MADGGGTTELKGPKLGTYVGKAPNFTAPGDHVTFEVLLLAELCCAISCDSELSPSKGGSKAWRVEGTYEFDDDDDEILVSVTKEDPSGGPRSDREVHIRVDEGGSLSFRGIQCTWAKPPPDLIAEELATMSLKDLKAAALAAGLDPAGCVERKDFESLLRRARASGALNTVGPPKESLASMPVPASPVELSERPPAASPAAPQDAAAATSTAAPAAAPPAAAPEAAPAPPAAEGEYSLEQLTDKRVWEKLDVKATEREVYLPDAVFTELFGMPKADFAVLPKWKKDNVKKKHGLF